MNVFLIKTYFSSQNKYSQMNTIDIYGSVIMLWHKFQAEPSHNKNSTVTLIPVPADMAETEALVLQAENNCIITFRTKPPPKTPLPTVLIQVTKHVCRPGKTIHMVTSCHFLTCLASEKEENYFILSVVQEHGGHFQSRYWITN